MLRSLSLLALSLSAAGAFSPSAPQPLSRSPPQLLSLNAQGTQTLSRSAPQHSAPQHSATQPINPSTISTHSPSAPQHSTSQPLSSSIPWTYKVPRPSAPQPLSHPATQPLSPSRPKTQFDLGFSFSVAGLLFPYHLGVAEGLKAEGLITHGTPLAGSSGGALAAAVTGMNLDPELAMTALDRVHKELRFNFLGSRLQIARFLHEELDKILPSDAHERLNEWPGEVRLGVTIMEPMPKGHVISSFQSRDDVIDVMGCSCHVPMWSSIKPFKKVRGMPGVDGLFSNPWNIGCQESSAKETCMISPFHADEIFITRYITAALKSGADRRKVMESGLYGGGIITPHQNWRELRGHFFDLPFVWAALEAPLDPKFAKKLFAEGEKDAATWAQQRKYGALASQPLSLSATQPLNPRRLQLLDLIAE